MTKSSWKGLEVFDFKEEDEIPEFAAGKFLVKFRNPSGDSSSITKYNFIEHVACGTNGLSDPDERGNALCVDITAVDNDHTCDFTVPLGTVRGDCASKGMPGIVALPKCHEPGSSFPGLEKKPSSHEELTPGSNHLNCALLKSPSSKDPVDAFTDGGESMKKSSSSTHSSDIAEYSVSDGHASDDHSGGWEVDGNMEVIICPDFIQYRNEYCMASVVSFSSSCVKIEGSIAFASNRSCGGEWCIDDIINIESQWYGRVETAVIRLCVISKDAVLDDNVHGTSGVEELEFAVVDPNWSEKQEEILSLDVRYKAVWNVVVDTDIEGYGESMLVQRSILLAKRYFPLFDETFEEVIYPKGDSDAVSISKRDVDLLQPETFINDTIIDFYMKYLKNKIPPEEKCRFHFFNSFFFRKLADLDKGPSSASEGRDAFLRVRKWTRKVNLFEKDYIFIPVNFNLHWSLIIICHPGEVANFKDEDIYQSPKVPCILHMDSIKGSHTGVKDIVRSYLWEEWKERQKEMVSEDISSMFFNLRFVSLELPQQENSFDCGLFLLHYAELFLADAPLNFSPFKLTKFSNFLNVDWFLPSEVSLKRSLIQRLIYELLENRSHESSPAGSSDEHHLKISENIKKNETGVEFVEERFSPTKACQGNLLNSQAGHGIEITLLGTSSMRSSQCMSDSGLVLRELFDAGVTAGSFLNGQYQSFDQNDSFHRLDSAITPIEAEAVEHFVYSPSGGTNFQRLDGITPEGCSLAFSCEDFRAETSWNPGIPVQLGEHEQEDVDSSPDTSVCASEDSLEVGFERNSPVREDSDLIEREAAHQTNTPSTEDIHCYAVLPTSRSGDMQEILFVDSQDLDKSHACSENEDSQPTCPENPVLPLQNNGMEENQDCTCHVQFVGVDQVLESDEQQPAKRLRLTPPLEADGRLTRRSLSPL